MPDSILPADHRGDPLHQHVVIIGKTGSGKTYTAKGLVERLVEDGRRVCIIDPTGVWWGLRSSPDGTEPRYPVAVFGGDHGDMQIAESTGAVLAELIANKNLPAIIDLSEFLVGERTRFMTDFAEHLYRHNRSPLHLIIDEADEFAPQNPLPESKRMSGSIDRIVRRGRVKGFRVMLITQRPAVLHKNVLTQANSMIALRLIAPQDRKAIEDWIKGQADVDQGKAVLSTLAKLKVGEGWVWSPEHGILDRRFFPAITTYDSSRTPDDGEDLSAPVSLADVDLSAIEQSLIEPPAGEVSEQRIVTVPDPEVIARAHRVGQAQVIDRLRPILQSLNVVVERLCDIVDGAPDEPADFEAAPAVPSAPAPSDGALHPAARAILTVLVTMHPARLTWQQAATLAGLKARGGHFNAGRKALREGQLIDEQDGMIAASAVGMSEIGTLPDRPQSPAEVLAMWKAKLPAPAPQMLDHLSAMDERGSTRDDMAAALGKQPRGGHWNNGMSLLRNNGLIEEVGGRIRLVDILRDTALRNALS